MTRAHAIDSALAALAAYAKEHPGTHATFAQGEGTVFVSAFDSKSKMTREFPFEPEKGAPVRG